MTEEQKDWIDSLAGKILDEIKDRNELPDWQEDVADRYVYEEYWDKVHDAVCDKIEAIEHG